MTQTTKHLTSLIIVILTAGLLFSAPPKQVEKSLTQIQTIMTNDNIPLPKQLNRYLSIIKKELPGQNVLYKTTQSDGVIIVEVIVQEWQDGAWVNQYRDTQTHREDMNIISMVTDEWDGAGWVPAGRMSVKMDDKGNLTEMMFEDYRNGSWLPSMRFVYTYDAAGKLLTTLTQLDEDEDGTLENFMKAELTYDGNGHLIVEKSYIWDEGDWMSANISAYTNDDKGRPLEQIDEIDIGGGETFKTGRWTFEYTAEGYLKTETYFNVDFVTMGWAPASRYMYEYNALGQETSIIRQTWDAGAWVNESRDLMTYDANGNETLRLEQSWDGSKWVDEARTATTYGANNMPSEVLVQVWDGSWQNLERWTLTYQFGTHVAADLILPTAFTLTNYPNPFNPVTTISYSLATDEKVSLEVFDLRGKKVATLVNQAQSAGAYAVPFDGADLASGIYLYTLQAGSTILTHKLTLIK